MWDIHSHCKMCIVCKAIKSWEGWKLGTSGLCHLREPSSCFLFFLPSHKISEICTQSGCYRLQTNTSSAGPEQKWMGHNFQFCFMPNNLMTWRHLNNQETGHYNKKSIWAETPQQNKATAKRPASHADTAERESGIRARPFTTQAETHQQQHSHPTPLISPRQQVYFGVTQKHAAANNEKSQAYLCRLSALPGSY